jgi:hypothetical protein
MENTMLRSPLFPRPTDKTFPTDFLRNYLCFHYDICLEEAADKNLLLDCGTCIHRDSQALNLIFKTDRF